MSQKQAKILGVGVNSTSKTKVLSFVRSNVVSFRKGKLLKPVFIATPNPEMVVLAQKELSFASALNSSDIAVPDGVGLAQSEKFLSLPAPKNILLRLPVLLAQGFWVGANTILFSGKNFNLKTIKGRELFLDIVKLANKKKWKVFLLGGEGGVAEKTKEVLKRSFKRIVFESFEGPFLTKNATPVTEVDRRKQKDTLEKITKFSPDLLFVAFGAPKQERWVAKHIDGIKAGVVMVVGGTFNYISGERPAPPSWMEKIGTEWVWRLLTEPKRAGRILTAFPILPLKVFWGKLVKNAS